MSKLEPLPPLDEYVEKFKVQYEKQVAFQAIVHDYLQLSGIDQIKFSAAKIFRGVLPGFWDTQLDKQVRTYASHIYTRLEERQATLQRVYAQEETLKNAAKISREQEQLYQHEEEQLQKANTQLGQFEKQKRELQQKQDQDLESLTQKAAQEAAQTRRKYDVEQMLAERVKLEIQRSGLADVNESGQIYMDENAVGKLLEDRLLDAYVLEAEADSGRGLMARAGEMFSEETIGYETVLAEHPSDIAHMDPVESMILSNMHGFDQPTFPHIVMHKPIKKPLGLVGVDSAVMIDTSGSMDQNNRIETARTVGLANNALMRRLHEKNRSYLGHFASSVRPRPKQTLSARELWGVYPEGDTDTATALNWLLYTLKDSGKPSIASLVTDGEPNNLNAAVRAAESFNDYDNVHLTIYLIDPTPRTRISMKQVGEAAGPTSRYMAIPTGTLGKNFVNSIVDSMSVFYDSQNFANDTF